MELVFHDVTKIPNDPADPKQVRKKRHVGNDYVHIVWSDHCRDYRPNTLGGDFGNVQILISPLPESPSILCVNIYRDTKLQKCSLGPLPQSCLIPSSLLAPLVRLTALYAHRAAILAPNSSVEDAMSIYYRLNSYTQRQSDWTVIANRHKFTRSTAGESGLDLKQLLQFD